MYFARNIFISISILSCACAWCLVHSVFLSSYVVYVGLCPHEVTAFVSASSYVCMSIIVPTYLLCETDRNQVKIVRNVGILENHLNVTIITKIPRIETSATRQLSAT